MRRSVFAIAALLLALAPFAARAQTATFTTSCDPNMVVTNGGLTLQASAGAANGTYPCIANFPKYSGLWYFEFTVNALPANPGVWFGLGLGIGGPAQPVNGGMANNYDSTILGFTGGAPTLEWGGQSITGMAAVTAGQTGAVAVDLDTDPPQIWVTPNVAGTGGYSGGPEWNNSTTSSPLVMGSGLPTSGGTGFKFILPGQAYFPVFSGQTYNGSAPGQVTFNFGASTFSGTVPSGYTSWNTVGGAAPVPGPTSPLTINVANAPAWQASTTYVQGDRVVAGPAWNGSAYTSGDDLYLWVLTGGYGGKSGTSASTFNACPNPANYGGGLLGNHPTQWLGATNVNDGALTWTCLTPVDYTTFTAMNVDGPAWQASTTYYGLSEVTNGGNAYTDSDSVTSCTSASSGGPTGTGSAIADGTCSWSFAGTVPYSSEAHVLRHQLDFGTAGGTEIGPNYNTTVNLWYGGREAQTYQDGAGGEADPILFQYHTTYTSEYTPYCHMGDTGLNYVTAGNCNGAATNWYITLQAAAGDGFADNMTPGVTPFGYPNAAYGVTFYSDSPFPNGAPFTGGAFAIGDSYVNFFGLQFLATQGPAFWGSNIGNLNMYNPGNGHPNAEYFNGDILYAGGSMGAFTVDAGSTISNSTITYNGTETGCFGILSKFGLALLNDTIIGPGAGASDCTAILLNEGDAYQPPDVPYYDNVIIGFANPWAYSGEPGTPVLPLTVAGNNAVDLPSNYTPPANFQMPGETSNTFAAAMLPGVSVYSISPAAEFVDSTPGPGMDLRLRTTGNLYNGGAAYSVTWYLPDGTATLTNTNQPDIFGNNRPQGTRYDIGAYQVSLGCPSAAGAGCH